MASTNKTKNLGLSQWLATDKPSWLNDVNVDLEKIDEFAGEVEQNQVETVGKINQVNATIEDMQKEVTANRDSITATEERITEVEKDTANLQISVNKLNTDYSSVEGTVSQIEQTTEQLATKVDDAEKQIAVNTSNITAEMNRVDAVETKVAMHTVDINAIHNTIGDWDDVYEASTITQKVQELEQGGGSGSDDGILIIPFTDYTNYSKSSSTGNITLEFRVKTFYQDNTTLMNKFQSIMNDYKNYDFYLDFNAIIFSGVDSGGARHAITYPTRVKCGDNVMGTAVNVLTHTESLDIQNVITAKAMIQSAVLSNPYFELQFPVVLTYYEWISEIFRSMQVNLVIVKRG